MELEPLGAHGQKYFANTQNVDNNLQSQLRKASAEVPAG